MSLHEKKSKSKHILKKNKDYQIWISLHTKF